MGIFARKALTRQCPLPRGEVLRPPTKKQPRKISKLQDPELGGSALGMESMLRQPDLWAEHRMGSQGISASSPHVTLQDTLPLSWPWLHHLYRETWDQLSNS